MYSSYDQYYYDFEYEILWFSKKRYECNGLRILRFLHNITNFWERVLNILTINFTILNTRYEHY